MPGKTQRSVSLPLEVYEYYEREWQKYRVELYAEFGISTFTGFVVKMLKEGLQRYEQVIRPALNAAREKERESLHGKAGK